MLIGYERVSTDDQNLALQHDALQNAQCEKIFSDKMSGVKADRPGLKQAFEFTRKGDTLIVWRLDRLGRCLRRAGGRIEDEEAGEPVPHVPGRPVDAGAGPQAASNTAPSQVDCITRWKYSPARSALSRRAGPKRSKSHRRQTG